MKHIYDNIPSVRNTAREMILNIRSSEDLIISGKKKKKKSGSPFSSPSGPPVSDRDQTAWFKLELPAFGCYFPPHLQESPLWMQAIHWHQEGPLTPGIWQLYPAEFQLFVWSSARQRRSGGQPWIPFKRKLGIKPSSVFTDLVREVVLFSSLGSSTPYVPVETPGTSGLLLHNSVKTFIWQRPSCLSSGSLCRICGISYFFVLIMTFSELCF